MTNDEIVRALRCYASDCNNDDACFQCTFAWMCDKFDGNAPKIIADAIESLQAQLADSQRREQAAVEDIMCRDHCDVCISGKEHDGECKTADYNCLTCKSTTCMCRECRNEDHWEWRGPQEAGKGEAE